MAQNQNQANIGLLGLWQSLGNTGDLPAGWNGPGGSAGSPTSNSTEAMALDLAQKAQAMQVAANQPAIATAQAAGTSLADQYTNLLNSVTAQGSATYNTATSGENAYLGQRGLLSQTGLGNNLLSQAQNTVNTTNAANQAQIQTGAANTQEQVAQYIASLQAGNVPGALTFGNNVANTEAGITNTNTQYAEALQAAQLAASEPFNSTNGLVFKPATGSFGTAVGSAVGGGMDINKLALMVASMKNGQMRQPMNAIGQFVR